jgi:hypothetical protein
LGGSVYSHSNSPQVRGALGSCSLRVTEIILFRHHERRRKHHLYGFHPGKDLLVRHPLVGADVEISDPRQKTTLEIGGGLVATHGLDRLLQCFAVLDEVLRECGDERPTR